jgi:trk system potassium uptake protein
MKSFTHPSRVVALAFLALIAIGTALLMLPVSHAPGVQTPWLTALFTAVLAVRVTGLTVVDTGTHWSGFGQAVI